MVVHAAFRSGWKSGEKYARTATTLVHGGYVARRRGAAVFSVAAEGPPAVSACRGVPRAHRRSGLRRHALKTPAPRRDVMTPGDSLDRHETDVVAVAD